MNQPIPNSGERPRLHLYFLDLRIRYAVVVLLLGLILVEADVGKTLLLAGTLWLGAALLLAMKRPSDQEVDELLAGDLKSLVQKALRSLGPHEMRAAPLALLAPAEPGVQNHARPFVRNRAGKDGGSRSPVNHAVVVVPMEDQLGVYSCQHDSLSGETTQVSVEEHHYRDVVTVRLEEDVEVAGVSGQQPEKKACHPTQVFSLEFTNGRRLSVPVSVAWQEDVTGEEGPLPTGLEKTVLAIRALMRDKR
jgi:hypothetical protein